MEKILTNKFASFTIFIFQLVLLFMFVVWRSDEIPLFSFASSEKKEEVRPYLHVKEMVYVNEKVDDEETGEEKEVEVALPVQPVLFEYIEVIDGCGPHFEGECLLVRAGPGTDFPKVSRLRNGMVLKVGGKVERASTTWYKIVFDEWLRYPERLTQDWYVASDYVTVLLDEGDKVLDDKIASTSKKIIVSRSKQTLTAYDGKEVFMQVPISTGLALTPTPRGTFRIYKKTPSRYMQGPLPNIKDKQHYDLPGVPWNLYFTEGGAVIHGAYWHKSFGSPYSHGCVNLSPENAHTLYSWADLGTTVVVRD